MECSRGVEGIQNTANTKIFKPALTIHINPQAYKCAHAIKTEKSKSTEKGDYTTPKGWRPISLLNITGKALEFVMVTKVSRLTDQFDTQTKCLISIRRRVLDFYTQAGSSISIRRRSA